MINSTYVHLFIFNYIHIFIFVNTFSEIRVYFFKLRFLGLFSRTKIDFSIDIIGFRDIINLIPSIFIGYIMS